MSIYTDAVNHTNFDKTLSNLTQTLDGPEGKKTQSKITSSTQVKDLLNALADGANVKGEIKRDWDNSFLINPTNSHLFGNSSTQEALVNYLNKLADESPEALGTFLKSPAIRSHVLSQAKDSEALKALYEYMIAPDESERKNELHNTLSRFLHVDGYGISALGGEVGELQESSNALISALPGLALRTLDEDVKEFKATFRENEEGSRQFEIEESVTKKEAETIVDNMSFLKKDGSMQVGDVTVPAVTIQKSDLDNLGVDNSSSPLKEGETFNFREWFIDIQSFTDKDDLSEKASKALMPYAVLLARSEKLVENGKLDEAKEIQKQMKALKKVMTKGYKVKGKVLNLFRAGLKNGISKEMVDLIAKKRSGDTEARELSSELEALSTSVNPNIKELFDGPVADKKIRIYTNTAGKLSTSTSREVKSVEAHEANGQRKAKADADASLEGILEENYTAMTEHTKDVYGDIHKSITGENVVSTQGVKDVKGKLADFSNDDYSSKTHANVVADAQIILNDAKTAGRKEFNAGLKDNLANFAEKYLGESVVAQGELLGLARKAARKAVADQTPLEQELIKVSNNIKELQKTSPSISLTDLVNSLDAAKTIVDSTYNKEDDKELLQESFTELVTNSLGSVSSKDQLEDKVSNDSVLRSLLKADGKEAADKRAAKALTDVLKAETKNADIDNIIEGVGLLRSGPLARLLHAKDLQGGENEVNHNVRLYGILAIAKKAISNDPSEKDNILGLIAKELNGEKTKDITQNAYDRKIDNVKKSLNAIISKSDFDTNTEAVTRINDQTGDLNASIDKIIYDKASATGVALVDFAGKFLGEDHVDVLIEAFTKTKAATKAGLDTYGEGGKSPSQVDNAARATFGEDEASAKAFYSKLTQGSQDLFDTNRRNFGRNGLVNSLRQAYILASSFLNNVFSSSAEGESANNKKSYDYLLDNDGSNS